MSVLTQTCVQAVLIRVGEQHTQTWCNLHTSHSTWTDSKIWCQFAPGYSRFHGDLTDAVEMLDCWGKSCQENCWSRVTPKHYSPQDLRIFGLNSDLQPVSKVYLCFFVELLLWQNAILNALFIFMSLVSQFLHFLLSLVGLLVLFQWLPGDEVLCCVFCVVLAWQLRWQTGSKASSARTKDDISLKVLTWICLVSLWLSC